MSARQKITPFLWFDNNAEEAMNRKNVRRRVDSPSPRSSS